MEPSLLSGKLVVCAATLDHYSPLPSNCTALCTVLKWAQDLISRVSQVSTTLSLTWTLTRKGPRHEALSPMGSASTELTAVVLTTPLTGKHNLAEPGLLNSGNCLLIVPAWCYIFRAVSAWFDARSWFHSLCKRVMEQDWSWNRPALDYIELYHSASKFWETNQWWLLSDATVQVLQAPGLGIAVQKHRPPMRGRHCLFQNNGPSSMYVCFLHFNPLYSFLVPILVPLRSLPEPPMWQSFRNMICDNLIGNGRCNSLHEFYWITMQMNPLMYILLCNVVNRSVLSCKWFKKKHAVSCYC